MTVLDRNPLQWFCQLALRRGLPQREALALWREAGNHVSDSKFREIWNQQKAGRQ